jgi:hypothetical protein
MVKNPNRFEVGGTEVRGKSASPLSTLFLRFLFAPSAAERTNLRRPPARPYRFTRDRVGTAGAGGGDRWGLSFFDAGLRKRRTSRATCHGR